MPKSLAMSFEDGMPVSPRDDHEHFPTFHYDGKESLDLPEEGILKVHFRKIASGMSERDGKKQYSCTVEVRHILDVKAEEYDEDDVEPPTRKHNESDKALDELMEKKIKSRGY